MSLELARVASIKSTWVGQWKSYRVRVFKQGIHWTYLIKCECCDMSWPGQHLCATKKAATSYAWEAIQRDAIESAPCPHPRAPP